MMKVNCICPLRGNKVNSNLSDHGAIKVPVGTHPLHILHQILILPVCQGCDISQNDTFSLLEETSDTVYEEHSFAYH